jgi:hypothetical protein
LLWHAVLLYKKRIPILEFVETSGLGRTAIYRYVNGGKAHTKNAYHIEKITNGEVKAKDIMGKQHNGRKKGWNLKKL